jgi:hypothetical protein
MNIIALALGGTFFYVALFFGYRVFFSKIDYWKWSTKIKSFYRKYYIFNWWLDFLQRFPEIEITIMAIFCFIFLIFACVLFFIAFHGPIVVYW